MESFFDEPTYNSLRDRLRQIDSNKTPEWGKMDAAQMFKHCQYPIQIALEKEKVVVKSNWFAKVFFKKSLYSDKPFRKSLPTAPSLKVADSKDFESEKEKLDQWMQELWYDRENDNRRSHPMFGHFTKDQWGKLQYKHLDHHFRQFGV